MTNPTTLRQLADALSEKEAKATKGPWHRWGKTTPITDASNKLLIGCNCCEGQCPNQRNEDADFSVHARNTAPQLIQALREAAEEIELLTKKVSYHERKEEGWT